MAEYVANIFSSAHLCPALEIKSHILAVGEDEECIIIGAIIKDMTLRPNVLKEYAKEVFNSFIPLF